MQCNFVVDSNGAGAILRMDKNAAIIGKFTLITFCLPMAHIFAYTVSHHDINNTFYSLKKPNFDA